MLSHFKDWAIPGPKPYRFGIDLNAVPTGESLDALSGHFKIYQRKNGHRYSTDDLLVAWYGTTWCGSAKRVLELGSGIGSVGMISAWRLQGAQFVAIEAQEESVALQRKSLELNGLNGRYDLRQGDFRDPSVLRFDEQFDLVLGSPPYFPLGTGGLAEDPQKLGCRFEVRGDVRDYIRVASQHLAPGGVCALVFPMERASGKISNGDSRDKHQEARVLEGARVNGMTVIRQRPVRLKEDAEPLLSLYALMNSRDLPEKYRDQTWVEPDLIIRCKDGSVHPEYATLKMAIGFPPF
ncbi:MAG: methyltransferase [Xanthomonadaceae bacterium]|nr:methyltransferase [Xanthomonadaceae bacterium]